MDNVRSARRKQQHLVLMAAGAKDESIRSSNVNCWDYLRKRHRWPSRSLEKDNTEPPVKSKLPFLPSSKNTFDDSFKKGEAPFSGSINPLHIKHSPTSYHRDSNADNDPSVEDGAATVDSFEPLSISKWLLSMKSPLTPLSPRSDYHDKSTSKASQTGTTENIPSWLQTMKLPIAPLSPTEIISTPQNALYPVWVPQGVSGVETVLPDSPSTPVALISKPMPEVVPSPLPSTPPEDLRSSTRPPPTVVVIPNKTSYTELCHVQQYSSSGSPRLCNLVTHRSNNSPSLESNNVMPESRRDSEERKSGTKKKTKVTIEIETGGECVIFLPADGVEYRVVARKCSKCSGECEDDGTLSTKTNVSAEPIEKPSS